MNDIAASTIHAALRGLSVRQRTIADNIANLETPGFLAGKVDFEDSLKNALSGNGSTVEPRVSRSLAATNLAGNNVNLDEETLSMTDANLRYQTMVEAMNTKFRLLRTAITG